MKSIRSLIDRALELRTELATREKELAEITAHLIAAGLAAAQSGKHEELVDSDRTGTRWLAKGSGCAIPIIFTADKIMGSFQLNSPKHQTIKTSLGPEIILLPKFFKPVAGYENLFDDGKKFRATAAELLGPRAAPFVTACLARDKDGLPKSDIKIDWDHKEPL